MLVFGFSLVGTILVLLNWVVGLVSSKRAQSLQYALVCALFLENLPSASLRYLTNLEEYKIILEERATKTKSNPQYRKPKQGAE